MIKTAFAAPDRTMTARITMDGAIYGPEVISSIKLNRGVSLADQWEIGTAYAQVVTFELIDEMGDLLQGKTFLDKRAKVEIGVEIDRNTDKIDAGLFGDIRTQSYDGGLFGGVLAEEILDGGNYDLDIFTFADLGEYTLLAPEKIHKTLWRFDGTDDMAKADVLFVDDLIYPQTVSAIFQAAVAQAGLTTDTVSFPNSDAVIALKPAYYDMTIREVLADAAEIAAGFCFIEAGKVRIKPIIQDAISVTGENIISFRRHEDKDIKIDQLIIRQNGAENHVTGTGSSPYFISDNVFIQGDPQNFAPAIYTALNGIALTPCEVEFNGNPCEALNGWINLDFLGTTYKVLPMAREIDFSGGMREKWTCNALDNLPHDEAVTEVVRTIIKQRAKLLILDDSIVATVKRETDYIVDTSIPEAVGAAAADFQLAIDGVNGVIDDLDVAIEDKSVKNLMAIFDTTRTIYTSLVTQVDTIEMTDALQAVVDTINAKYLILENVFYAAVADEVVTDAEFTDLEAALNEFRLSANALEKYITGYLYKSIGVIATSLKLIETGIRDGSIIANVFLTETWINTVGTIPTEEDLAAVADKIVKDWWTTYSQDETGFVMKVGERLSAGEDWQQTMERYFDFNLTGMTIGLSGSPFKTILDESALSFYDGVDRVTWISNKEMRTTDVVVIKSITLGVHKLTRYGTTDLTIGQWVGPQT